MVVFACVLRFQGGKRDVNKIDTVVLVHYGFAQTLLYTPLHCILIRILTCSFIKKVSSWIDHGIVFRPENDTYNMNPYNPGW